MTFTSLASSSKGNCYVVDDGETRLLLECGISMRRIQKGLNFGQSGINACLVTHEHKDHSRSVQDLVGRGMRVYASEGTAASLYCSLITTVEAGEQFRVGSFEIMPFETFHDAEEPLGFLLYSRADGERLAFATDTVNLPYRFPGVNVLSVEANHDRDMLSRCTHMPEKTRYRVSNTHMEIRTLCRCLRAMDLSDCREIHLLHLSGAAGNEGGFVEKVRRVVPEGIRVEACGE